MKVRVRVVHVQPKKMMIVDLKQRGRLGALGVGMGCHGIGVENEFEVEVRTSMEGICTWMLSWVSVLYFCAGE